MSQIDLFLEKPYLIGLVEKKTKTPTQKCKHESTMKVILKPLNMKNPSRVDVSLKKQTKNNQSP